MVISESALRWRRASSHQRRKAASSGAAASVARWISSSSIFAGRLGLGLAGIEAVVGFDDALHQWVTNHIFGLEVGETDPRNVLQHLDDVRQARLGAAWQVDLGDVAGDHRGRAEADA